MGRRSVNGSAPVMRVLLQKDGGEGLYSEGAAECDGGEGLYSERAAECDGGEG